MYVEVKSAGWNRYNSSELQVGGKCLIEISINDLEQCDRNNNKGLHPNPSDHGTSENSKIEQQKLKQGPLWLHGYIQEMHTNREPVLVFIKDLGEKKFVPYDALKPLPVVRKNKQKNWVAVNKNQSVNSDSSKSSICFIKLFVLISFSSVRLLIFILYLVRSTME